MMNQFFYIVLSFIVQSVIVASLIYSKVNLQKFVQRKTWSSSCYFQSAMKLLKPEQLFVFKL